MLNKKLLEDNEALSVKMGYTKEFGSLPEKIIQFGEGNFMRAFSDYMIQQLNQKGLFNGRIVAVQPIQYGLAKEINAQDGLYTLIIRGIDKDIKVDDAVVVSSISRCLNPYTDWDKCLECAQNPEIEYVFSNTTEAGIAYNENDKLGDSPQASFPGKLTNYLYHRYCHFNGARDKGMKIFACELVERGGDKLKTIVLKLIDNWNLPADFRKWIEEDNYFLTTLVDRIVSGYPRDEIAQLTERLGYEDKIMCTAECFYLWVIEGPKCIKECIPFVEGGLNVIWTDDVYPYKTRKVRLLNGTHIATVPVGLLYGLDNVYECINHEVIGPFMEKAMYEEILPSIENIDVLILKEFADSVIQRYKNPYINHKLLAISLNSVSKFKERIIPSLIGYKKRFGTIPQKLAFSFAALLAFYKGSEIKNNKLVIDREKGVCEIIDEVDILKYFLNIWKSYDNSNESIDYIVKQVFENKRLWDMDLFEINGLYDIVCKDLKNIIDAGIKQAILKF